MKKITLYNKKTSIKKKFKTIKDAMEYVIDSNLQLEDVEIFEDDKDLRRPMITDLIDNKEK